MKIFFASLAFSLVLVFYCAGARAQSKLPPAVEAQLAGKKKFYDIKDIIENYYKTELKKSTLSEVNRKRIKSDRKKWNRVFFDAESRLNAAREVENASQKIFEYVNSPAFKTTSIGGSWQLAGPTSVTEGIGRINRIAFDPSNSLKLYAGSSGGGLFVTTNGGLSWSNVGSFIPSLGISGIVVSHANANTIYILTGDGDAQSSGGFTFSYGYVRYSVGVLKSTDGGTSWQKTGDFPGLTGQRYTGLKLVQDPNDANILLAATSEGLFRTTNGGATWTLCDLFGSDDVMVYDVEYKPGSSTTVYVTYRDGNSSTNGRFIYSTNGGQSFNTVTPVFSPNVFTSVERIAIAVTPAAPSQVFLLAGPGNKSGNSFKGLWRSTDNGLNFSRLSSSPNILGSSDADVNDQNFYDLALAVSPSNSNVVLSGGLIVFKSVSGGVLWSQATSYFGSPNIHPDVHDLAYNPLDGKLWAATDGGMAVSSDDGSTWARRFVGLSCTQFYHFALQDDDGDIWGGAQDNGVLIKNGSASSFDRYNGGDGYDVLTDLSPAGNQDDKYYSVNEKVYADATIDEDITPAGADNFFANLAMHVSDEDVIFAGYERLYVSYNRGSDWSTFSTGNGYSVSGSWCVSTCPSNNARVYSAGRATNGARGLWRIDGIGVSPTVTSLTSALTTAGWDGTQKITDIAIHPSNSNRIWVTIGGFVAGSKVFYSSNAGGNWTNISDGLPNLPANCVLADASGNVYAGTDIGVYYRGSTHTDWTPFYNDLPRVPVTEMEFLTLSGNVVSIYASTYGRGIWFSAPFTDCPSTLTVNQQLQGQQFYQAGTTLTTTSSVDGVVGTDVNMKAGTEINLTEGFQALTGTEFRAYLGPCNNDVPQKVVEQKMVPKRSPTTRKKEKPKKKSGVMEEEDD